MAPAQGGAGATGSLLAPAKAGRPQARSEPAADHVGEGCGPKRPPLPRGGQLHVTERRPDAGEEEQRERGGGTHGEVREDQDDDQDEEGDDCPQSTLADVLTDEPLRFLLLRLPCSCTGGGVGLAGTGRGLVTGGTILGHEGSLSVVEHW